MMSDANLAMSPKARRRRPTVSTRYKPVAAHAAAEDANLPAS